MLTGTLVNVATVLVGSLVGMLLGKAIPKRVIDIITKGLGLCTVYLGITGMFDGENALITIISVVIGAAIGELTDLDGKVNRLGKWVESKTKKEGSTVPVAEGFVSASLLFCVGAMTIMGSLQSGLSGDHSILFAKSTLDLVSSMIFASTLGFGVMLAAGSVFVIQGGIALLASVVAPYLENAVGEMNVVGSILLFALGLNIIGLGKFKIMNYVPAIFIPILLCIFM